MNGGELIQKANGSRWHVTVTGGIIMGAIALAFEANARLTTVETIQRAVVERVQFLENNQKDILNDVDTLKTQNKYDEGELQRHGEQHAEMMQELKQIEITIGAMPRTPANRSK